MARIVISAGTREFGSMGAELYRRRVEAPSEQRDHLSRGALGFVWAAVIGYGWASSHGASLYGGAAMVGTTAGLLVVFAVLLLLGAVPFRLPGVLGVVMGALAPGALLNVVATEERLEVSARWVIWFVLLVMSMTLAAASSPKTLEKLQRQLPGMLAVFWLALYIKATYFATFAESRSVWHLSGLYANLTLALGLFAPRQWQRFLFVCVGLVGVFMSGSAGAAFGVPLSLVPYLYYQLRRSPGRALVASVLVGFAALIVLLRTDLGDRFLDRKLGPYATFLSGRDRAVRSGEGRIELIREGLALSRVNPFGSGLGPTYAIELGGFKLLRAHNGFISTLIQAGWITSAVVGVGLVVILWRIARNKAIPGEQRAFYFTYVATNIGRSLSEDIGIFDLGNISSMLFLYFTAYFYLVRTRRTSQLGNLQNRISRGPTPMLPRSAHARVG